MNKFLMIESRDPSETADVGRCLAVASKLAATGQDVTVYLVQNAVLRTRSGARFEDLDSALNAGVHLLADDFSLQERGISPENLRHGITLSPIEAVIDGMADGATTIWN